MRVTGYQSFKQENILDGLEEAELKLPKRKRWGRMDTCPNRRGEKGAILKSIKREKSGRLPWGGTAVHKGEKESGTQADTRLRGTQNDNQTDHDAEQKCRREIAGERKGKRKETVTD